MCVCVRYLLSFVPHSDDYLLLSIGLCEHLGNEKRRSTKVINQINSWMHSMDFASK